MSNPRRLLFLLCLCVSAARLTDSPAAESAHCTLKTLAAVDLSMREPGPLVPAMVDGHPVWFILQTDEGITELFAAAVAGLGLHTESLSADLQAQSGGKPVKSLVSIQSFSIASLRLPKKYAWVDPSTEVPTPAVIDGRTVLGSLGTDVLWPFDFELDPTRGKFTLYAQNHCGARAVYWPGTVQRLDVEVAAMGNFFFAAQVNGKPIDAGISIATQWTHLRADVAQQLFGVSATSSELAVTRLTAGPLALVDTQIRLVQPPAGLNYCKALTAERPTGAAGFNDCLSGNPLTLGLDIVGKLRMYFATRDRAIYFTSNDELTAAR
jgi:hypothetical protein